MARHAPEALRQALIEGLNRTAPTLTEALGDVENFQGIDGADLATKSDEDRARWLMSQLRGCTDTLPAVECEALDLVVGSSYASAVERLSQMLNHEMAGRRTGASNEKNERGGR